MKPPRIRILIICFTSIAILFGGQAFANEDETFSDLDGPELSGDSENASNPLAAVNNTDIRWQYTDGFFGDSRLNEYFIDGAFMLNPKLKFKYELHYWDTNVSGSSESDWESAIAKLIYFPHQGISGSASSIAWLSALIIFMIWATRTKALVWEQTRSDLLPA